ncbi:MAG: Site-specific recombinases, DNA invertase Pin homologs, partial [uncultured Sphingomonadaceae bacterium]
GRPARGVRGVHHQPAPRGLDACPRRLRRRRLLRRHHGQAGPETPARRGCGGQGGRHRCVQDRPAHPQPGRLLAHRGRAGRGRGVVRVGDAGLQHDDQHGQAHPQRPALLRPVRARGHRRAHPRQDRRIQSARHVDGRRGAARLSGGRAQAGSGQPARRDRADDLPPLSHPWLRPGAPRRARRRGGDQPAACREERAGVRRQAAHAGRALRHAPEPRLRGRG